MKRISVLALIVVLIIAIIVPQLFIILFEQSDAFQESPISIGEYLDYYSSALTIPVTLIIFCITISIDNRNYEREKEEKRDLDIQENEPHFTIELEQKNGYFSLTIYGCGECKYRNIYFYDNYVRSIMIHNVQKYKIAFSKNEELLERDCINIDDNYFGLDEDGYPLEFVIVCESVKLGAIYLCCFNKENVDGQVVYHPREVEVIDWK